MDEERITPQHMGIPPKIGNFVIPAMSWKDFSGEKPEYSWFLAQIYWNVSYNIIGMKGQGFKVEAKANLGKKSWHRPEGASKELLQHEYGHYLICCLAGLQFRKKANEAGQTINDAQQFQKYCANLIKQVIAKYCKFEKRYDQETHHYLNRKQQKQWEEDFVRRFKKFQQEQKALKPRLENRLPQIGSSTQKIPSKKSQSTTVRNTKTRNNSTNPRRNIAIPPRRKNLIQMKKNVDKVIDEYKQS